MTDQGTGINRRHLMGGAAGLAALAATGARGQAPASVPPLPKSPVAINVIDVGGALALMQKAFDAYRRPSPSSSRASPS